LSFRTTPVDTRPAKSESAVVRALLLAGYKLRWMAADFYAARKAAWDRRRLAQASFEAFPASQDFSELASFKSIEKHRAIAVRFGFGDPFYRCHDRNSGSTTSIDGRPYVNFASYDYLGLNGHPDVVAAAKAAIDEDGTSVSASRIVAGERPVHGRLEAALADLYETEAALTFVSGHATNVSTISTLVDGGDLVLYDELAHNSLIVGTRLSGAEAHAFRHNDLQHLEHLLRSHRRARRNALILVEGLYSMDGDIPDLQGLIDLKERYGAWLMVDEAHALGVLGERGHGIAEHFGVPPAKVDIWMGTLSKALASCGGYIAGSRALIDTLKFRASGHMYSVGLSPPLAAASLASLEIMRAEPERVARVRANGAAFLARAKGHGLDTITSAGCAIVPVLVGDIVSAGRLTDRMLERGVNVLPIIYPAVPLKAARLRFFITSAHTREEIDAAVDTVAEELRALGAS
jgi:8-amino-7-oxononanoate synthase